MWMIAMACVRHRHDSVMTIEEAKRGLDRLMVRRTRRRSETKWMLLVCQVINAMLISGQEQKLRPKGWDGTRSNQDPKSLDKLHYIEGRLVVEVAGANLQPTKLNRLNRAADQ